MEIQRVNIKYDKQTLVHLGGKFIDFILPPLCPATGAMVDRIGMVSPDFWQKLNFIHAPFCDICGIPFSYDGDARQCGSCLDHPPLYRQARAALRYDDGSRDIILRFKHGDQTHAVQAFIPWIRQAGHELLNAADIIIPVPLHRLRMIKRRYNQADLIGKALAKNYPDKTYLADGLTRQKNTMSQGHKSRADREKNIKGAFIVPPKYKNQYEGKTVLIIDDVYTTGSTVNECAKTLYRAGAQAVDVLTLAKIVKT